MLDKVTLLKAPGTIPMNGIKTMSDRGIRITVDTQEMDEENEAILLGLRGLTGWFVFSPNAKEIDLEEVAKLPAVKTDDEKSPSERLHARMFVYFTDPKGLGRDRKEFNEWYLVQIDKIGQSYLDRMK